MAEGGLLALICHKLPPQARTKQLDKCLQRIWTWREPYTQQDSCKHVYHHVHHHYDTLPRLPFKELEKMEPEDHYTILDGNLSQTLNYVRSTSTYKSAIIALGVDEGEDVLARTAQDVKTALGLPHEVSNDQVPFPMKFSYFGRISQNV